MSPFQTLAIQRLLEEAHAAGIKAPREVAQICGTASNHGALTYANLHPDDDDPTVPDEAGFCCEGVAMTGDLASCTCWEPVYDIEQAEPKPPASTEDLRVQPRMCDDCAFRKGSPERASQYEEETLFHLATTGTPFWCHDGMLRPARWVHPLGMVVDGDPDDWTPPQISGIPYRADGSPGLLCAGWAARAAKAGAA